MGITVAAVGTVRVVGECVVQRIVIAVAFERHDSEARPDMNIIIIIIIILSTQQRGFRCHRGCEDNIAALLTILRMKRSAGRQRLQSAGTHLVFVDFSKAYDRVPHNALLAKLHRLGLGDSATKIIKEMLTGTSTQAHTCDGPTPPVEVKRGLPQGHTISPMLFALYLNDLLLSLQRNKTGAASVQSLKDVACLAYADDIVIVADTAAEAQTQLDTVRQWADDWGMQVNLSKGKTEHMYSVFCIHGDRYS